MKLLILLSTLALGACATGTDRQDSFTQDYREIPASGTGTLSQNRIVVPQKPGFERIDTMEALSGYIGHRLVTNDGNYKLLLKDGSMVGEKNNQSVQGKWKVQQGSLCYAEGPGPKSLARKVSDCVLLEAKGHEIKMTSNSGRGKSTLYRRQ